MEMKYIPQIDSFLLPSGRIITNQEYRYLLDEATRYPSWTKSVFIKLAKGE